MAINLSKADHNALDAYLDGVLDAYKAGDIPLSTARSDLAHAFTAAAIDNEGVKDYIRLDLPEKWRHMI